MPRCFVLLLTLIDAAAAASRSAADERIERRRTQLPEPKVE